MVMYIILDQLEDAYNKAVEEGKTSFFIEDQEFLTDYAKYLIEYLKTINNTQHGNQQSRFDS
jgi:hypothetical protein